MSVFLLLASKHPLNMPFQWELHSCQLTVSCSFCTTRVRSPARCSFQNSTPTKQVGYTMKLTEQGLTGMEMYFLWSWKNTFVGNLGSVRKRESFKWRRGEVERYTLAKTEELSMWWQKRGLEILKGENNHQYHPKHLQHTTQIYSSLDGASYYNWSLKFHLLLLS